MCNFAVQINGYRKMTAHRRSNNLTQLTPHILNLKHFSRGCLNLLGKNGLSFYSRHS